jgi:hypothetical protein
MSVLLPAVPSAAVSSGVVFWYALVFSGVGALVYALAITVVSHRVSEDAWTRGSEEPGAWTLPWREAPC